MTPARELVVISGKGGTGKTSVVAAFAALAGGAVLADCDVDAADLHLVLQPEARAGARVQRPPSGDHRSRGVHRLRPLRRGLPLRGRARRCRRRLLHRFHRLRGLRALPVGCVPADAIRMEPVINGAWMVSETRFGPLVHARLGVAEDNSGKLVTLVRNEARRVAEERGLPLVIVDGSPGIGCPVIASLAGADLVLAVTEPTVSGRHDLERVLQVVRQFRLPFAVCVNKADLNPELGRADRRRGVCGRRGVRRHRRL